MNGERAAQTGLLQNRGGIASVRVKVCGFTCESDAVSAVQCGVDVLGFNGWKGSRRWVDLSAAAPWISRLPETVTRVVLLVNAPLEEALATGALPFVDMIQFHGEESAEYLAAFARSCSKPFLRAVALQSGEPLPDLDALGTSHVLLDASVPGAFGGTGVRVDWDLARRAVDQFSRLRIFLAGGLTPENVEEAVRRVRPYAVDVASGVEAGQPGRKDAGRMAAFVRAARRGEAF